MSDKEKVAGTAKAAARILIVEDARFVAARLQRTLTGLGYDILGAVASGEEALQVVSERRPDLVLMDIELAGELNGIETSAQIRAQSDIPVIYLTGHAEDTLLQQAKITAPYGYLIKPAQDKELHATIEMALHRHELEETLRASEERLRNVLENSRDATYELNLKTGAYDYFSPSARQSLGFTPEEILALGFKGFEARFHPQDRERLKARFDSLLEHSVGNDVVPTIEYRWKCKDGEYRWFSDHYTLVRDNDDQPSALIGSIRDITAQVLAEEELWRHRERLEELVKERTAELTRTVTQAEQLNEQLQQKIIERVCAERALRESEERLRTLLNSTPSGIVVIHAETHTIVNANPAAMEMIGAAPERLIGSVCHNYICPAERGQCPITDLGQTVDRSERVLLTADGKSLPILKTAASVILDGRQHLLESFIDITERVQAEEALRVEKERAQQYLDVAGVAFVVLDSDGHITLVNKRGLELLGYREAELVGRNWFETCLPKRLREQVHGVFERLMTGEIEPVEYHENPVLTKDGAERIVAWHNTILRDGAGSIVGTLSSGEDITERVRAEKTLRQREHEFKTLVEHNPDMVTRFDRECRHIYVNPAVEKELGIPLQALLGKTHRELGMPAEQADWSEKIILQIFERGQERVFETVIPTNEGVKHYLTRGVPEFAENGSVASALFIHRNVTERMQAEEALKQRNRELALLNRVIAAAASTLDVEQVLQITCKEMAHAFDLPQTAATLLNAERTEAVVVAEYRATGRPSALDRIIPATSNPATEYVLEHQTPLAVADVQTDARMAPVHDLMRERGVFSLLIVPVMERGEVVGTIGLDAIERREFNQEEIILAQNVAAAAGQALETARLYQELQHHAAELARALEKQQELDRLRSEFIRNVSHELRTPLAIARGHAELLETGILGKLEAEQRESVTVIARRTRTLSRMMDDFAAIIDTEMELQRRPVDLGELVHRLLTDSQLRATAEQADLTLSVKITPDLSPISGDPIQLQRVVDNLLVNAFKFTPAGGHVAMHLGQEEENLVLEVTDTGIGIPADQLERVFERFYQIDGSTTRRYGGTGLGLALVKEIVEAHGGTVEVKSEVGQGSFFTATLPIYPVNLPTARRQVAKV